MEQKKSNKNKQAAVFYICLCICVAVIGAVGYISGRDNPQAENGQTASESAAVSPEPESRSVSALVTDEDDTEISEPDPTQAPEPTAEPTEEPEPTDAAEAWTEKTEAEVYNADELISEAEEEAAMEEVPVSLIVEAADIDLMMPVDGEPLTGFSDALEYNNALAEWRTHDGIDIAADEGTEVKAAASGTITEIFENHLGKTVLIDHGGECLTRYGNLADTSALSVGQSVSKGEVIGAVGNTAHENITQPHLHFEMYMNGKPANPLEIIN